MRRGFTPFKLRAWWFHSDRSLLWPVSCSSQLLMVHMTAASRGSFATTQSSSLSESCVWALSITLSEPILIRIPILSATNDRLKLFNSLPAKPGCEILSIFTESQAAWICLCLVSSWLHQLQLILSILYYFILKQGHETLKWLFSGSNFIHRLYRKD